MCLLRLQVNIVDLCSGHIVRQLQGQGPVQAVHLLDNSTCLHVQLHRANLHYVHSGQLIRWQPQDLQCMTASSVSRSQVTKALGCWHGELEVA